MRDSGNATGHGKPGGPPGEDDLVRTIRDLLATRRGSICPSDAARAAAGGDVPWRPLMEPVRAAARQLAAAGEVEITQRGRVVDPGSIRGPIRIRRAEPEEPG